MGFIPPLGLCPVNSCLRAIRLLRSRPPDRRSGRAPSIRTLSPFSCVGSCGLASCSDASLELWDVQPGRDRWAMPRLKFVMTDQLLAAIRAATRLAHPRRFAPVLPTPLIRWRQNLSRAPSRYEMLVTPPTPILRQSSSCKNRTCTWRSTTAWSLPATLRRTTWVFLTNRTPTYAAANWSPELPSDEWGTLRSQRYSASGFRFFRGSMQIDVDRAR